LEIASFRPETSLQTKKGFMTQGISPYGFINIVKIFFMVVLISLCLKKQLIALCCRIGYFYPVSRHGVFRLQKRSFDFEPLRKFEEFDLNREPLKKNELSKLAILALKKTNIDLESPP
jgi:hypothetical protein